MPRRRAVIKGARVVATSPSLIGQQDVKTDGEGHYRLFNQQRANTAEIYQPPSVTENTTRLLDKDS